MKYASLLRLFEFILANYLVGILANCHFTGGLMLPPNWLGDYPFVVYCFGLFIHFLLVLLIIYNFKSHMLDLLETKLQISSFFFGFFALILPSLILDQTAAQDIISKFIGPISYFLLIVVSLVRYFLNRNLSITKISEKKEFGKLHTIGFIILFCGVMYLLSIDFKGRNFGSFAFLFFSLILFFTMFCSALIEELRLRSS